MCACHNQFNDGTVTSAWWTGGLLSVWKPHDQDSFKLTQPCPRRPAVGPIEVVAGDLYCTGHTIGKRLSRLGFVRHGYYTTMTQWQLYSITIHHTIGGVTDLMSAANLLFGQIIVVVCLQTLITKKSSNMNYWSFYTFSTKIANRHGYLTLKVWIMWASGIKSLNIVTLHYYACTTESRHRTHQYNTTLTLEYWWSNNSTDPFLPEYSGISLRNVWLSMWPGS